jgi:hypothetical protein
VLKHSSGTFECIFAPKVKAVRDRLMYLKGLAIQQFGLSFSNEAEQRGRRDPVAINSWP